MPESGPVRLQWNYEGKIGGGRELTWSVHPRGCFGTDGLKDEVYLEIRGSEIVIRSKRPREGWEEDFRKMAACGDDALPEAGYSEWDEEEAW